MQTVLLIFFLAFSLVWGIWLRYIPFTEILSLKQKRILKLLYTTVLLINVLIIWHVLNSGSMSRNFVQNNMILLGIVITLINIAVMRKRVMEHLFTYGLAAIYNYIVRIVAYYIGWHISRSTGIDAILAGSICFCLFFGISFPFLRKMFLRTVTPFLVIESGDYWHTVCFVPVAIYYACILAGNPTYVSVGYLLSRISLCVTIIFVCNSVAIDHKRLSEKMQLDEQLAQQKAHYAELSGKVLEARRMRHDFKHHIAAVYRYIETDDKSGLRDYCDQMILQEGEDVAIPYTGNIAADGVFYRYMQIAQKNNIQFQMSGVIRNHGISDVDLCVLLGNALDNAVNGCMTIQENRYINVMAEATDQILSLIVQNSFDGMVQENAEGEVLSRRRKNASGVGLASMHSVCEKYDGTMELQYDESEFTVFLMLPLGKDREELHLDLEA